MNIKVSYILDITEKEAQDIVRQYLDFIIHVMEEVYTSHRFDTVVDEDASAPKMSFTKSSD